MKTASENREYDPMEKLPGKKTRKEKSSSRKKAFYPSLKELCDRYSISSVNQFGESIISGRIIC